MLEKALSNKDDGRDYISHKDPGEEFSQSSAVLKVTPHNISSSSPYTVPLFHRVMFQQILSNRYIKKQRLLHLLQRLFGSDYEAEVRLRVSIPACTVY